MLNNLFYFGIPLIFSFMFKISLFRFFLYLFLFSFLLQPLFLYNVFFFFSLSIRFLPLSLSSVSISFMFLSYLQIDKIHFFPSIQHYNFFHGWVADPVGSWIGKSPDPGRSSQIFLSVSGVSKGTDSDQFQSKHPDQKST